ncbi:MAG: type II secretion system F family protein [Solirubrobacteraceae bacterium]
MINPPLAGLAAAACCGIALRGYALMRAPSPIERRELSAEIEDRSARRGPLRALIDVLGARLGPRLLARLSDNRRAALTRRLDLAGRSGMGNLERYAEVKAAVLVLGGLVAILFALAGSWPGAALWMLFSWLAPDVWLSRTGRRRQERIERDIPDFIDVLAITVRAGTGYRAALHRVSLALSGPVPEEVLATLRQMDLGATRREAFQALRERNDSRTLDNFVAAQLQAEELGVPLADALANIASDTRRLASQNARRRAQRAAPRITLIVIALLLPATIMLIVAGVFLGSGVNFSHIFG